MSLLGRAMVSRLTANSGVTALVSSRISPWRRIQGEALPAITYESSEEHTYTTTAADGHRRAELTLNCWASTYLVAHQVAEAAIAAVAAQQWSDGATGVEVDGVFVTNRTDVLEEQEDGQDAAIYRNVVELEVHYRV